MLPVAMVLSKGGAVEKPHHPTAGVFLFVGAIFFGLAKGVTLLEEVNARQPPASVQISERHP